MGGLIGLLLIVVLAAVVMGPILAILAWTRVRAVERRLLRVDELARDVARLERRVAATPPPATRPSPTPEQPRPVPPPERKPAPAVLPPVPAPEPVAKPASPTEPARERPGPAPPPVAKAPSHAPPPPSPPPGPPPAKIDWERWIGIRGAAVLGAVALGLAGLLFFKYSIDHGLITPAMRVVLGTIVGVACIAGSEPLRRRGHRHLAEGVSGAGVVILYSAFWAAHALYGLIGLVPAFGLMVLVTVTCVALALRHAAFVVAVLGLVGGFATPILLSSGADRPIGLFGYVLLLDLGLLALGHRRRWPSLGVMSLLATVAIQALWIGTRMGPDRMLLGLTILAVFAVVFVLFARLAPGSAAGPVGLLSQAGAILFPFAFALYFAARVDLGPRLYPVAILMALLAGAAGWISRGQGQYGLGLGAAAASVAVTGVWLLRHPLDTAQAWEAVAVGVGLSIVFHAFVERERESPGFDGPAPAAMSAAAGFLVLFLLAGGAASGVAPWPWLAGQVAITVLLWRRAGFPGRDPLHLLAAAALAGGMSSLHLVHSGRPGFPPAPLWLALMIVAGIGVHVAARRRPEGPHRMADHAAAALPVVLLVALAVSRLLHGTGPVLATVATLLLGVLVALAATRLGSGPWYAGAVAATWFAQAVWSVARPGLDGETGEAATALGLQLLTVGVLTAWPFLAAPRFSTERFAWYAAALSGPVWFPPLRRLFEASFGDGLIGILPLVLGALAVGAAARARRQWTPGEPMRLSALVWFSAVGLGFVSVAIPLQLEKEWITIGWALEGLAVIALWRRLDHPGLKYFGLVLLGASSIRLVANPALLGYYQRSTVRIFNWLLYTYAVPVAALLGSAALLRPLEPGRVRKWERGLYTRPLPLGSLSAAVAAVVVIFVWINLSIADWFSKGPLLTLSFGDTPAQRLTVSIAWAVYALVLLSIGMARDSLGLRWVSLGFLLMAIVKVFFNDLGHLRDLYRVASLVGAAVSLLLVSFLYQRFVFRKGRAGAS